MLEELFFGPDMCQLGLQRRPSRPPYEKEPAGTVSSGTPQGGSQCTLCTLSKCTLCEQRAHLAPQAAEQWKYDRASSVAITRR